MATSGQITVTTAGTAVQGDDEQITLVLIRALSDNTGLVYVGNDGANDVTAANGYELSGGDQIMVEGRDHGGNLQNLWFDSATNGDKLCWLKA